MRIDKPILLSLALFLVYGCSRNNPAVIVETDSGGKAAVVELPENWIAKTGILTNPAHPHAITKLFPATGFVISEHNGNLSIPSPADGKIVRLYKEYGNNVKRGSLIAVIENSDFIRLQQDFLEAENEFAFFREEYTRQGELTVENATSIKKMQIAKRNFQNAELRYNSLALQMKLLGIDPDSLNADNMIAQIPVYAKVSGIVTGLPLHEGEFARKGEALLSLSNARQSSLVQLYVDEDAFPYLHKDSTLFCFPSYDSLLRIEAVVQLVTGFVNPDNHKVTIIAAMKNVPGGIIPGMSVNAQIPVKTAVGHAVLSSAIYRQGASNFVFAKYKNRYHKIKVEPHDTADNRIIISGLAPHMTDSIVISGVDKLAALFSNR